MENKKVVFSAVAPSGNLHIGNYLGAIKWWLELQENKALRCIFSIADLHALTIYQPPQKLREKIFEIAMIYLAAGIDPQKSILFIQSHVPEHAELAWILNTITKIPELELMTQFKEKAKEFRKLLNVGLFDYPVLMASDILLYKTSFVPVGEDQKQHLEFARTIARRFNKIYGEIFFAPELIIKKESARIKGLDDPKKKMSKSAKNPYNYIALLDSPDIVRDKIQKAVTDSGSEIVCDIKNKPGISNLLTIYSLFSGKSIKELEKEYQGIGYGKFKKNLAEVIVDSLSPLQKRIKDLKNNKDFVEKILAEGAGKAGALARETMKEVKNKVGLY